MGGEALEAMSAGVLLFHNPIEPLQQLKLSSSVQKMKLTPKMWKKDWTVYIFEAVYLKMHYK